MKKLLTILFVICSVASYAQGGWIRQNTTYGIRDYRRAIDSTFLFPAWWGGAPVDGNKAALRAYDLSLPGLFGDTANKVAYIYWPKDSSYQPIGTGVGGLIPVLTTEWSVLDSIADPSTYTGVIEAGDVFLVAEGATGAFANEDNHIAIFEDPGWDFDTAQIGDLLFNSNVEQYTTNSFIYKYTEDEIWLRQTQALAHIGGDPQMVRLGSTIPRAFQIITNNAVRVSIDKTGVARFIKMVGADTSIAGFTENGTLIKFDLDSLFGAINIPIPDLQSVTDVGNSTTNPMASTSTISSENNPANTYAQLGVTSNSGYVAIQNTNGFNGTLLANNLTGAQGYEMPDTTGVLATGAEINGTTYLADLRGIIPLGAIGAGAVTTVGTFENISTAKGLSISGSEIKLHAADATNPGALTTVSQDIAGLKTFTETGMKAPNLATGATTDNLLLWNATDGFRQMAPGSYAKFILDQYSVQGQRALIDSLQAKERIISDQYVVGSTRYQTMGAQTFDSTRSATGMYMYGDDRTTGSYNRYSRHYWYDTSTLRWLIKGTNSAIKNLLIGTDAASGGTLTLGFTNVNANLTSGNFHVYGLNALNGINNHSDINMVDDVTPTIVGGGAISNTAGYPLTIQAGRSGTGISTDLNGGDLDLSGGISEGTGTSKLLFKTASAGVSGIDNTPSTKLTLNGDGTLNASTDYSANYTSLSYITKGDLDAAVAAGGTTDEHIQDVAGGILTNSSKISLTYNDGTPSIVADIIAGSLVNGDINASAAIDASKIGGGGVSTTEYDYLSTVTSDVQTQLNKIYVWTIAGQSNAQGQGDSTTSPDAVAGTVYQYYEGVLSQAQDPIGNAATGSAWPAFGIKWHSLTGQKVCFVPAAFPSTSQIAASDIGNGNWSATGTLLDTAVARTNAALAALTAAGYTPVYMGVLWSLGETDASAITAATITKAQFKTGQINTIANFRTALGAKMPFNIFRTGGTASAGLTAVHESTYEVDTSDRYTQMVFLNAADFPARGLNNGAHYFQFGYDEMGTIGAVNVHAGTMELDPLTKQSDKVGIGVKNPSSNLHVVGTTTLTGAVTVTGAVGVTGNITTTGDLLPGGTTLTKDVGAAATVWRAGYFGTLNSGTGNPLTLRTANSNQPIIFQNAATEAMRVSLTNGNLLIRTTTDVAAADRLQVNGNVNLITAGNKIKIATGTNASIGVSGAMVAGTITVSTTAVTAGSLIYLSVNTPGGTQGFLSVGTIVAATSFVINSSGATDTSTVNWWIIN